MHEIRMLSFAATETRWKQANRTREKKERAFNAFASKDSITVISERERVLWTI